MARNHIADIQARRIDQVNIIGIRKALSAAWRAAYGYSTSSTAPSVTQWDVEALWRALAECEPVADSKLTATGLAILTAPRWRKRFTEQERAIIDNLNCFRLVRFDDVDRGHFVPVWRAVDEHGNSFLFRNIPWQSAWALGLESGPVVQND